MSETSGTASDAEMSALIQQMASGTGDDVAAIDALLTGHPGDPRLHFLRGSVLAGSGRALEAHRSLTKAVEIAPDFAIARFQLGFFELTSGEAGIALETWGPLDLLPDGHYLRHFVDGLRALIADRFADCIAALNAGIAVNSDNLPLNNDMQLIIAQCVEAMRGTGATADPGAGDGEEALSATSLLLGRFVANDRPN